MSLVYSGAMWGLSALIMQPLYFLNFHLFSYTLLKKPQACQIDTPPTTQKLPDNFVKMYGGAGTCLALIHSEGTTVPLAGLSRPVLAQLIEQATSQASGLPSHISPQSSWRIGKQPAYGSVSDVSENVLQCAVHNTSRGTHISPTSIKSAGSFKTQHYKTKPQVLQSGGVNIYAPQPQIPQAAIQAPGNWGAEGLDLNVYIMYYRVQHM